ncbi:MAG: iron ABC transporter substrate-binding protein [Alphaproteobacteria bacterium]|nr:iron ABC transporter substrate-binding protein [Alphaproteobacteria bacterium]
MSRSFCRRTLLAALTAVAAFAAPSAAQPTKVTDVIGREVTVALPAKRIMLGFYFEDFLAVGGPEAMNRVVGISKAAWKDWRPQNWEVHLAKRPSLDQLADVGEVEVSTFSVEKVIALKPDLVILADWQAKGIGADLERLVRLGIPVVVTDYHTPDLAKHSASTRLFGKLLGTEKRAEAIVKEQEDTVGLIRERVARSGRPRPKIYIELGNKGPAEQGVSYGDYMWGAMANDAGGANITRQVVKTWAPVSPEQVLAAKPEVILIAGSEWRKHATAQLMGEGVGADEARARLNGFLKRPGWADLPAVKEGRVHAVYHGASRTIPQHAALQHVAKILYPDLFADLDPETTYRNFYRKYMPIVPEGTFMLNLTPGKV